eukprot:1807988-Amphidinium_carterae.1
MHTCGFLEKESFMKGLVDEVNSMLQRCRSSLAAGALLWWLSQALDPIRVRKGTQAILKDVDKHGLVLPKALMDRAMLA